MELVRDVVRWMSGRFAQEGIESARWTPNALRAGAWRDRVGLYPFYGGSSTVCRGARCPAERVRQPWRGFRLLHQGKRDFFGLDLQVDACRAVPATDSETSWCGATIPFRAASH
jgi:hypothetical protein